MPWHPLSLQPLIPEVPVWITGVFWCSLTPRGTFLGDPNQTRVPEVLEDPNLGAPLLFAAYLGDALPFRGQLPLPNSSCPSPKGNSCTPGPGPSWAPAVPHGPSFQRCPFGSQMLPVPLGDSPGDPKQPRAPRVLEDPNLGAALQVQGRGWETEDGKDIPDQRKGLNPVSQPGRMGKGRRGGAGGSGSGQLPVAPSWAGLVQGCLWSQEPAEPLEKALGKSPSQAGSLPRAGAEHGSCCPG